MKIMQLRYYREVCRYGSITKASKELHISQPTITNAIHDLEKEFSVNLFHRQKKSLILTHEGKCFWEQVEILLDRIDTVERNMKNLGGQNNHIQIGIPPMIGTVLFPSMFSEFYKAYPEIKLEVQENGSLLTKQQVLEDQLDLAIVILDEEIEKEFNCFPIMVTQLVYCVNKSNPISQKTSVNISELIDEPIILMKSGSFQNVNIKKRFEEINIQPNIILYSNQLNTIKEFIQYNNAGAFLFEDVILNDADIIGIPLNPPMLIKIGLIWKKGKHNYSGATQFISFTKNYDYKK